MNRPNGPFPVSKAMDLNHDHHHLQAQLETLARYPEALTGQCEPMRQWEYAMALYAIATWQDARDAPPPLDPDPDSLTHALPKPARDPLQICDVGGAGSHFWQVLTSVTPENITVVDPNGGSIPEVGQAVLLSLSIEEYAAHAYHNQFDVLTSISVIEHVEEVRKFFRACHMLLKPGGLLFLTTDYWDAEGPDTAHFHWMRKRIYNADRVRKLLQDIRELGFKSFGTSDWGYHGPQVYDYSACSVALVKKG